MTLWLWWWSNGQRICLLLRWNEFESHLILQFLLFEKKENKQKRGRAWPLLKSQLTLSIQTNSTKLGSGYGPVGRAVASNTRGPWFETSQWQILHVLYVSCIEKTEIIKKIRDWPNFFSLTQMLRTTAFSLGLYFSLNFCLSNRNLLRRFKWWGAVQDNFERDWQQMINWMLERSWVRIPSHDTWWVIFSFIFVELGCL